MGDYLMKGWRLFSKIIANKSGDDIISQFVKNRKLEEIITYIPQSAMDVFPDGAVSKAEGLRMAWSFGCNFLETSAKTAHNVPKVFEKIVCSIALRQPQEKRSCIIM
jgi:GTPase KRas protein